MTRASRLLVFILTTCGAVRAAGPEARFDAQQRQWTLSNGLIEAAFQLTADSRFQFLSLRDLKTGDAWIAPPDHPSSPNRAAAL